MTPPAQQELSLQLWDLRSQLEGQMRCLTKIHPGIDAWATLDAPTRQRTRTQVINDLEDLVRGSQVIAEVAKEARIVATRLPSDDTP